MKSSLGMGAGSEDAALIAHKLDVLIVLTLCSLQGNREPPQVTTALERVGLTPREIARVLGVTPNAVRVARYQRKVRHTARRRKR